VSFCDATKSGWRTGTSVKKGNPLPIDVWVHNFDTRPRAFLWSIERHLINALVIVRDQLKHKRITALGLANFRELKVPFHQSYCLSKSVFSIFTIALVCCKDSTPIILDKPYK
jgi:hypothetical protein